ncbi:MAG: potassium-transporting ATPase subunit KdpC [Roseiflexaceae bacterium]|nr:potassium-transporting ATPase subunit KdpC [Roseiflexaceae bacterium]
MLKQLRPAIVSLVVLTILTGLAYPLLVTGISQVLFNYQANGSIIRDAQGNALGSELIGQQFDAPQYLWGRLSATGPLPYTAFNGETLTGSSGSNLGPLNPALEEAVQGRIDALREADPANTLPIPVDLVTASGSGLDPHVSPAAAEYQVTRIAEARDISADQVRQVIAKYTEGRTLGLFGEPRVNVLRVNLELDGKIS